MIPGGQRPEAAHSTGAARVAAREVACELAARLARPGSETRTLGFSIGVTDDAGNGIGIGPGRYPGHLYVTIRRANASASTWVERLELDADAPGAVDRIARIIHATTTEENHR